MSLTLAGARFLAGVLPLADSAISRFDAEHLAGIYPELSLKKELSGQSNIVFNSNMTVFKYRGLSGTCSVSFNASMTIFRYRGLSGTCDIVFTANMLLLRNVGLSGECSIIITPYMTMGMDSGSGLITRY